MCVTDEIERSVDRGIADNDKPVCRVWFAIHGMAARTRDDGEVGAILRFAVRVDVRDGGPERLARKGGGECFVHAKVERAAVYGCAVGEELSIIDDNAWNIVAAGGDAVHGIRPAEGDDTTRDAVAAIACSSHADCTAVDGDSVFLDAIASSGGYFDEAS